MNKHIIPYSHKLPFFIFLNACKVNTIIYMASYQDETVENILKFAIDQILDSLLLKSSVWVLP